MINLSRLTKRKDADETKNLETAFSEDLPSQNGGDIRETMRTLPNYMQPFLTWLTGKPLSAQPYCRRTPLSHLLSAIAGLLLGVALSSFALTKSGLLN